MARASYGTSLLSFLDIFLFLLLFELSLVLLLLLVLLVGGQRHIHLHLDLGAGARRDRRPHDLVREQNFVHDLVVGAGAHKELVVNV